MTTIGTVRARSTNAIAIVEKAPLDLNAARRRRADARLRDELLIGSTSVPLSPDLLPYLARLDYH